MTFLEPNPAVSEPEPTISLPAPQPQSSLWSVAVVTSLTFLQLLLQFATQLLLAKYFGAGSDMDAFVAALAPPIVIATILSGSIGYVLVPVVAECRAGGKEQDAAAVAAQMGLLVGMISLFFTGLCVIAAPPLAAALCPGFTIEAQQRTAELLRICSVLVLANSLIAYLNALFHSFQRFAMPAIAGVMGTLITLLCVALLHQRHGIFAVAWAVVVGAAATVVLLAPLLLAKIRQSRVWTVPLQNGTRRCIVLIMPLLLATLYWRLDPLLDRFLGSRLPTGNIAHIGYAWRLISGLMLIGTSGLSIVAFPAIAAHAAAARRAELNAELAHALRFFLFLIVPVCIGLSIFATPVVRFLFEHGKFSSADTHAVSQLVILYVGVILGAGLGDLLSRTFYSLQDMVVPVVIGTVAFTFAAGVKLLVVSRFGAAGLVAATSLFYLLNAVALASILLWRLSPQMLAGAAFTLLRSTISSLLACLAACLVLRPSLPWTVLPAALCGVIIYLLLMRLLGDEFARKLLARSLRGIGGAEKNGPD